MPPRNTSSELFRRKFSIASLSNKSNGLEITLVRWLVIAKRSEIKFPSFLLLCNRKITDASCRKLYRFASCHFTMQRDDDAIDVCCGEWKDFCLSIEFRATKLFKQTPDEAWWWSEQRIQSYRSHRSFIGRRLADYVICKLPSIFSRIFINWIPDLMIISFAIWKAKPLARSKCSRVVSLMTQDESLHNLSLMTFAKYQFQLPSKQSCNNC